MIDREDSLTWHRNNLQRLADETGEVWYLLDGFSIEDGKCGPSSVNIMYGVPASYITPAEERQKIGEFHPTNV
mgnify:CR=1 FL=1